MHPNQIRKSSLVIFCLLFINIACTPKQASDSKNKLTSASPLLFYTQTTGEKSANCQLKLMDPESEETKILHEVDGDCPSNIRWNEKYELILFEKNNEAFLLSWKKGAKALKLAKFPLPKKTAKKLHVQTGSYWFSVKNRLRYSYMMEVDFKNIVKQKNSEGSTEYIFEHAGKKYNADGNYHGFGIPYIAFAVELKGKKWRQIDAQATASNAGDTLGFYALGKETLQEDSNYRNLHTTHLEDILAKRVCTGDCIKKMLNPKLIDTLSKNFNPQYDISKDRSGFLVDQNYYPLSDGSGLFVQNEYAHGRNTYSPAFFCSKNCKKLIKLDSFKNTQLSILKSGDWIVISSFDKRHLYKGMSEKPKLELKGIHNLTWLPYRELWNNR